MLKKLRQLFRAFFTLNKGEQRAIIIVLFLVLLVTLVNLMLPGFIPRSTTDFSKFISDIEVFRQEQQSIFDSVQIERLQSRGELDLVLARQKLRPFKFDPNDLPEELWKQLGLTAKQIKVIKNYESKGGSFIRKEDFKRIYCISDAEYQVLEPYIKIKSRFKTMTDSPLEETRIRAYKSRRKKPVYKIVELNTSDTSELVNSLNLPLWLAKRLINYRELLGGYSYANQLSEVYGFDSNRMKIVHNYVVVDPTQVRKLDLNQSSFKELLRHPYISYEITKEIVNYRFERGGFSSLDELVDHELISESLFIKLKPYLSIDEPN